MFPQNDLPKKIFKNIHQVHKDGLSLHETKTCLTGHWAKCKVVYVNAGDPAPRLWSGNLCIWCARFSLTDFDYVTDMGCFSMFVCSFCLLFWGDKLRSQVETCWVFVDKMRAPACYVDGWFSYWFEMETCFFFPGVSKLHDMPTLHRKLLFVKSSCAVAS